ncbi:MAG: methylated-DNA--[protein]-cysteine S-methyltransferase [Bacteroidota bacterium]
MYPLLGRFQLFLTCIIKRDLIITARNGLFNPGTQAIFERKREEHMYTEQAVLDYQRVEKAIEFIREHREHQPGLDEIASHIHLSSYHFQRLFTRWAGISPKKFLQYLTLEYAKDQLDKSPNLEEVAQRAGLSGTGRLHDLFISVEGMTPDQYRRQGAGLVIHYGIHQGPFGKYLLAVTQENRICSLQFIEDTPPAIKELKQQWAGSGLVQDQARTAAVAETLFQPGNCISLSLLARGTPFQIKIWEALLRIPSGEMVSYQVIAKHINNPRGLQAVGSAIGKNPIAWLIPCHRVIKKSGQISEYRWGSTRKYAILGWEASLHNH